MLFMGLWTMHGTIVTMPGSSYLFPTIHKNERSALPATDFCFLQG